MSLHRIVLISSLMVAFVSSLELVLDDAGEYIRASAAWTRAEGECAQAGHGSGFHHNNGVVDEDHFAVWNFTIAKDGCYWLEEFHPDTTGCDFTLSPQVPVNIHFCKGLHTAGLIDQSQRGGQWNRIVRLPFYTTHSAAIQISAKGLGMSFTGVWAADAFRLTWDAENCHHEESESDEAVAPSQVPEASAHPQESETVAPKVESKPEQEMTETVTPKVQSKPDQEEVDAPVDSQDENEKVDDVPSISVARQEEKLQLLQANVNHVDAKIVGSTLEPVSQCPATSRKAFHHDGLQKGQLAKATFHFDPPRDGCYLVEEKHPVLEQCKASANVMLHANFCKGRQAVGTLDQTSTAGEWTFLAALPFYAGHPGSVTLSNEGTEADTLAIFDQVRFTWSGPSCRMVESHPRKIEIRLTVDFQTIAGRLREFAGTLKSKLAMLADIPASTLRLTNLREGSIIAEILVVPSVVDSPVTSLTASQTIEKLQGVVTRNSAELCALTGASVGGCNVELTDLGTAQPSMRPVPNPKTKVQTKEEHIEERVSQGGVSVAAVIGIAACFAFLTGALVVLRRKMQRKNSNTPGPQTEVAAAMEEGKVEGKTVEEKTVEEDTSSTLCPSSDKQSEPSVVGDVDTKSEESKSVMSVVSAMSKEQI